MSIALSVAIPCYNEAGTIASILERVRQQAPLVQEILVVDDGSTDNTWNILQALEKKFTATPTLRIFRLPSNLGKGAAIREALTHATQPYFLIQDADLELDPENYARLAEGLDHADVVFGDRFAVPLPPEKIKRISQLANWIVTTLSNTLYGMTLDDQACGYKLFPTSAGRAMQLESNGFEICSEITAKMGRKKVRIANIPVSYHPRTMAEGKKIRWKDGFTAVFTLLRYRL